MPETSNSQRTPEQVLEYCEKATPGPWTADWDDSGQWYVNIGSFIISGNALRGDSGDCIESANAHLLANARTDLPAMAQRVMDQQGTIANQDDALAEGRRALVEVQAERDKLAAQVERQSAMILGHAQKVYNYETQLDALRKALGEAKETIKLGVESEQRNRGAFGCSAWNYWASNARKLLATEPED